MSLLPCGCEPGLDPGWHRVVCGLPRATMPDLDGERPRSTRSRPRAVLTEAQIAELRKTFATRGGAKWGREENHRLAAWLRSQGLEPTGKVWDAAKKAATGGTLPT